MDRLMLVGLDGATLDIVQPLAEDGRLPHLARLMRTGAWGTLQSTMPPVTPAAWTTIFTGKNPGKHGIYDFQEIDPQTYRFRTVRTDEHLEKTIWQLLSEAGLRSQIIDVPFTYPPRPLNGWMITGYGTPRTDGTIFTYPADLISRLPEDLRGEMRVALPANKFDRSLRFIEEWQQIMQGRRRLIQHLVSEQDWDFFMLVFSITDNMAHVFWTYIDPAHPNYYLPEAKSYRGAFFRAYEQCDRLLGEMMERAGPDTTTLVISDHGFGSVRPRQYLFERLLSGGYLQPKESGGLAKLRASAMRTLLRTYNSVPGLREWAKRMRPGSRNQMKVALRQAGLMPNLENIDFERSKIVPTNFGLRMWVNERGKFAHGIVEPNDKNTLLEGLSQYLRSDLDPVYGRPIIARTHLGKDLYDGPHATHGPDLIIEYANFFQYGNQSDLRNARTEGGHTPFGIFFAHGPAIRQTQVQGASLTDLAPTVLHLLGQPVPPDMDGRVLEHILTTKHRSEHPLVTGTVPARWEDHPKGKELTPEEQAELEKQFRQLGYL